MTNTAIDSKSALLRAILDESTFVRSTFTGKPGKHGLLWRRVVVRPVLIKGARHLQFSYFDATKDITKNYRDAEAATKFGVCYTCLTVMNKSACPNGENNEN